MMKDREPGTHVEKETPKTIDGIRNSGKEPATAHPTVRTQRHPTLGLPGEAGTVLWQATRKETTAKRS